MSGVHPGNPAAVEAALRALAQRHPEKPQTRAEVVACAYLAAVRAAACSSEALMEARLGLWSELRSVVATLRGHVRRRAMVPLLVAFNAVQHGRAKWLVPIRAGIPADAQVRRVLYDGERLPRGDVLVERRRLAGVAGYRTPETREGAAQGSRTAPSSSPTTGGTSPPPDGPAELTSGQYTA